MFGISSNDVQSTPNEMILSFALKALLLKLTDN